MFSNCDLCGIWLLTAQTVGEPGSWLGQARQDGRWKPRGPVWVRGNGAGDPYLAGWEIQSGYQLSGRTPLTNHSEMSTDVHVVTLA